MENNKGSFYLKGTNNLGILICHGLKGYPKQMEGLSNFVNKLGYTVSCPQFRGHGTDQENFTNTTVNDWYEDLENAYLKLAKAVKGVFVMGLSMGGTFTVRIAETYDILGLVTMNAPLIGMPLKEKFDEIAAKKENPYEIQKAQKALAIYDNFVIETGQISNLAKITAPLLVIQGALDKDRFKISSNMLTTYTTSKYLSRLDFKKSGHMIVLEEEKEDLFSVIANFLYEINN